MVSPEVVNSCNYKIILKIFKAYNSLNARALHKDGAAKNVQPSSR
jgi:hypothetical protein